MLARPAKPPPYGCFTLPHFQLLPALEALLGLLFANLFWVGLWDLLDNTIFPSENSVQMLSLVRAARSRSARDVRVHAPGAPAQVVGGALLLYFTNSLYEPPLSKFRQPAKTDAAHTDSTAETEQRLPLLRPLCVPTPAQTRQRRAEHVAASHVYRARVPASWTTRRWRCMTGRLCRRASSTAASWSACWPTSAPCASGRCGRQWVHG